MDRTSPDRTAPTPDVAARSVLAALVVRDGAAWLRPCLQSLAAQSHRRLGVIAIDLGSVDASRELLTRALGERRVLYGEPARGLAGAVHEAIRLPAAGEADYVLVLHDDVELSEQAVERMLEVAEQVERVGVVGAKVVDWEDERILREVGRGADSFGHPHSPLEDGEMDHGQYDRVREVLFVSSSAMLVSRAALERAGPPDERLGSHHVDLDLCWRIRLAGFRVLVTPLARARHRGASLRGERPDRHGPPDGRYFRERAALVSMLKSYRLLTLVWALPLFFFEGLVKIASFALTRRFEDALQLVAAWGWNLAHLPGTLRRRVRAQSVRAVPDRAVRRFMAPAADRLRRMLDGLDRLLVERRAEGRPVGEEEEGEPAQQWQPLGARATSFARAHPVAVAWGIAVAVGILATRHLVGPSPLEGGVLPSFPAEPSAFFAELFSGVRTTALGGTQPGSAALGLLGAVSTILFGSVGLAQKAVLAAGPPLVGMATYRATLRATGQRPAGVVAAGCMVLSAVVLWAFSEGRIHLLFAAVALPAVAASLGSAFGRRRPEHPGRATVAAGVALAFGISFEPGLLLAVGVLVGVHALSGGRRGPRGLAAAAGVVVAGLALALPTALGLLGDPGAAVGSTIGDASFASLARLALGPGPGSWPLAWFLPAAALVGLSVVSPELRGLANRTAVAGAVAIALAWASAAGHLPAGLANAPVYVLLAAFCQVTLVGLGTASLLSGIERQAFGWRQIAAAVLVALLLGGLSLQALRIGIGDWSVGSGKLPPAWPVVGSADGDFRVLWIGRPSGRPFPAPGGDPRAVVDAGHASLRYGLVDREGTSALDVGRSRAGRGYDALEATLGEILAGGVRHGGALLAPYGIGFLVADEGDVPAAAARALDRQVDLDRVPAGGLTIWRNPRWQPPAAVLPSEEALEAARSGSTAELISGPPTTAEPLDATEGGWRGVADGVGVVRIADQQADGWRLEGEDLQEASFPAYGWAIGFRAPDGDFRVVYDRQWVRTLQLVVLALLWAAAAWITRRPAG